MTIEAGGPPASPVSTAPKPSLLKPVLIAGLTFGVLESLPFFAILNLACCMPLLACGALGAWLHGRALLQAGHGITTALGAGVGALAGLVAGLLGWTVAAGRILAAGSEAPAHLEETMRQAQEMMPFGGDGMDMMPGGWALVVAVLTVQFFFNVFLFTGFATLGGVIGGAIMEKQTPQRPAAPGGPWPQGPQDPPPPKVFE